jgi:PAS domain S-box-containing protein
MCGKADIPRPAPEGAGLAYSKCERAIMRPYIPSKMKTKSLVNRKVQAAFASAVLILLLVGAISYRGIVVSNESDVWVRHTHEVLENLKGLVLATERVKASAGGFVLTGREPYVEAYRANRTKAEEALATVRQLTVDNPKQQLRIPQLERLAARQVELTERMIDLRRMQGLEAAVEVVRGGEGKRITDEFQGVVHDMEQEEARLLGLRNADATRRLSQNKAVLIFGTFLGLLIVAAAGWSVQRDSSRRGRAEDAFRDSEESYRMLLDGVQNYAIFMLDPMGKVVSWNAGAERIKGYTADEIIGHNSSCFYPAEDIQRGRPEEVLRMTAASGRHEEEGLRVRKNGSRFLANVTLTVLRDPAGNLLGFSEISRDLSERKESEAKYRGLLEAAPDAIMVVNQAGEIVLLNAQAEKQFGYRRDELVGQKVKRIIPEGFAERLIADGTRTSAEALSQHIGTGIELSARRKDGSEFPIEIMLSPLESAEGILVTAAIRDISVRRAADQHLVQMENRYRGLLEAAPDAMVITNTKGRIVLVNAQTERQFGYRRDELVGQLVELLVPQRFREIHPHHRQDYAVHPSTRSTREGMELSAVRKDGSEFSVEIMLSPLESAEGILVTAAIRDISIRKAAEKHLAQMEGRYRGLLEAAPDAMVVVNQVGEIVLLNAQAEKQFGYRRDELLGQKVKNIIPEGFAERLIADGTRTAAEALAQHIGTGIELSGRRKDGSGFPIEIMLSPLESPEGILVTAAIRDISVRKTAEKHLAQMEGRYRGLLEAAPDAMVVVNQGGEIVLLNAQAEKQFGYRRDELVGQKVKNIIPEGFAERLIADDLRSAADALAQQIGTGIELLGRRKDGSEFPIEIMLSPLESSEGILVTAAIRDITERKAAEKGLIQMTRELSLKHQLLASVVEGTTDPIYVRDLEHRFTLANTACSRLFGRSVNEVLGMSMRELLPNDSYYAVVQSDQEVVRAGATRTIEEVAEIDGISRTFLTTKGPYRDADQKTIGTIGIARDITERKKSEKYLVKTVADLKRSNDELQQFGYVASHDLQEPLRMVASYTQLLAKRYQGKLDSDADEFIAYAVDGCNRMQGLIQDLLAYSRSATNGKALREISGENSLKEALTNLRATIQESGAVVTHDALPSITTDSTQLTQVFQNLVGNAIKYRGSEVPHVHVSVTKNGGNEWIFSVRDNGLGIDPQYFERIFVLFQRLHGREEFEGTGIGLAICKKIVERLGGRIWVESQPEKGSTFFFALPEGDGKR